MKYINFSNIEELIFYDRKLQSLFPIDTFSIFEQWRLAQRVPMLREMGKHAVLDFLNSINDEIILVLESYFKEKIIIEKLNYNIAESIKIPITDICNVLCEVKEFNYFSTYRDEHYLYITFWR